MKARNTLIAVLALVVASTACQPPVQQAGRLSEEDVAAIRELNDLIAEAVGNNDASALTALATEDGIRMAPNEPAQQGRAAIQAAQEAMLGNVTNARLTVAEIDGRDGLAYMRGTYVITVAGEGMPQLVGKYVWIVRQQPDGSWLQAAVIWNSDLPLPQQSSGTEQ